MRRDGVLIVTVQLTEKQAKALRALLEARPAVMARTEVALTQVHTRLEQAMSRAYAKGAKQAKHSATTTEPSALVRGASYAAVPRPVKGAAYLLAKLGQPVTLTCPNCGDEGPHETNGEGPHGAIEPAFCCRKCGLQHDVEVPR